MSKRWLQILLLMFMTVGLLVGCGTGNEEEVQDNVKEQDEIVEENLDVEPEVEELLTESSEEETKTEEVEQLEDAEVVISSKSEQDEQRETSNSNQTEATVSSETDSNQSQNNDSNSNSNQKKEASESKSNSDSSKKESGKESSSSNSNSKQKNDKKQENSSSKEKESKPQEQEEEALASEPTVTLVINGPSDQGKIGEGEVKFADGDTVLDILLKFGQTNSIHVDYTGRGASAYVQGIANVYEFDYGPRSGWIAKVNGSGISQSAGNTAVKAGDRVEWQYTED